MSDAPAVPGDVPLVPGELRGYRQFHLRPDGLYPLVHFRAGAWDGRLERARCGAGADHLPPAADCCCGLYAWYRPGSATVSLGAAEAVVAARGRCILGDRGFRAAAARVEAVALPAGLRWQPLATARARRMLADRYPQTRVYRSHRRMLKDHPPQDVRALGVDPRDDNSRRYRSAAAGLCAAFVVVACALIVLPRETTERWWPLLLLLAVGWHAALTWLLTSVARHQAPDPRKFGGFSPDPSPPYRG
jgi:hypothetical protein